MKKSSKNKKNSDRKASRIDMLNINEISITQKKRPKSVRQKAKRQEWQSRSANQQNRGRKQHFYDLAELPDKEQMAFVTWNEKKRNDAIKDEKDRITENLSGYIPPLLTDEQIIAALKLKDRTTYFIVKDSGANKRGNKQLVWDQKSRGLCRSARKYLLKTYETLAAHSTMSLNDIQVAEDKEQADLVHEKASTYGSTNEPATPSTRSDQEYKIEEMQKKLELFAECIRKAMAQKAPLTPESVGKTRFSKMKAALRWVDRSRNT